MTGIGVTGIGLVGTGLVRAGLTGTGPVRTGLIGTALTGTGLTGTGLTGTGLVRAPTGDAEIDATVAERGVIGAQASEMPGRIMRRRRAIGHHDPLPGNLVTAPGHDLADLPRRRDAEVTGNVAVGHHPPGRDGVDDIEHGMDPLFAALGGRPRRQLGFTRLGTVSPPGHTPP